MRKIILQIASTLDGYIEGPNGEYDWCLTDQDYGMAEFMKGIDATFMGRKSYELTLRMAEAELPGFSKLKQYVFSTTLNDVKPGVTLIQEDVEATVKRIKEENGRDIWLFGGAALTGSLMRLGLVDEICVAVHPIILGSGTPMVQMQERVPLKFTGHKVYSSGLVMLTYSLT